MDTILKKQTNNRQEYNRELVAIISDFVEQCPDWRFHQLLQNIGVTTRTGGDMFFEESVETLSRVTDGFIPAE